MDPIQSKSKQKQLQNSAVENHSKYVNILQLSEHFLLIFIYLQFHF